MILSLRRMARKPIGAKSTNLSSNFLFSHAEASQGRREGVGSASSTAV
jgi:hypothetical protein